MHMRERERERERERDVRIFHGAWSITHVKVILFQSQLVTSTVVKKRMKILCPWYFSRFSYVFI